MSPVTSDGQQVIARAVTATATLDKNGTELICRDGFFMDKDVYIQCASVIPNLYTFTHNFNFFSANASYRALPMR